MNLHLTEFQRSARPRGPFSLAIGGKIVTPIICYLGVLIFSLQQQCEVERRICVVRRDP